MRRMGNVCIVLGTALILGALSLFLYNQLESKQAGDAAGTVLSQVMDEIPQPDPTGSDPYDTDMTEVTIDGYKYVGYLAIPALELELPVMSQWDYFRLKIAPCRYSGSTKTDNLVICAHNYVRHFGSLKYLSTGDEVTFTDMDGEVWNYQVIDVDILSATAVEEIESGEYDLTLFTCTYGGGSRVTVRCDQVTEEETTPDS